MKDYVSYYDFSIPLEKASLLDSNCLSAGLTEQFIGAQETCTLPVLSGGSISRRRPLRPTKKSKLKKKRSKRSYTKKY